MPRLVHTLKAHPLIVLTGVCLIGGLVALLLGVPYCGLPGSDGATHAVSALRMAAALESLSWQSFGDEFVYPYKYPPLGRLALALGFVFDGHGWSTPRAASSVCWIVTIALTARLASKAAVPGTKDTAAFFTVVFGLTCWLGVFVARTPLLEVWSTLVAVVGCLAYLRARDRRSRAWAVATGACIVASILVKYSYGPLLLGTIGLSALIDVSRPGPDRETLRLWPWTIGTVALGLTWWFVLPFPADSALGAAHWAMLLDFFGDSTKYHIGGPEYVIVAWGLMGCISLLAVVLQFAGLVWGVRRWRQPAARVCATVTLAGLAVFILFPYRLERALVPSLFGGWVLGGCLCARALGRVSRPWRAPAAGLLLVAVLGTAGLGSVTLVRLTQRGPWTAARQASVEQAVTSWKRVYGVRSAPAPPPPETQALLDWTLALMVGRSRFGWIGESLPYKLVQWRIFRESGDPEALYPRAANAAGKRLRSEPSFRLWAEGFPRIFTLRQTELSDEGTVVFEYERWMARHPGFHVSAREFFGSGERELELTLYERSP